MPIIEMGDEEGSTYFKRLYDLLHGYGREILIKKFRCLLPEGQSFKAFLQQKDKTIQNLCKNRILRGDQGNTLKTADKELEDYDITLLAALLLNLFSNELKSPKIGGFGTKPHYDTSDGANVRRLRDLRNKIAHMNTQSLTKTDFNEQWSYLTNILRSLAAPFADNEEILFNEQIHTNLVKELDIFAIQRVLDEHAKQDIMWQEMRKDMANIDQTTTNIDQTTTNIDQTTTNIDQTTTDTAQTVIAMSDNLNKLIQQKEKEETEKDMLIVELQEKLKQKDRELAVYKPSIELQQKQEEKRKTSTEGTFAAGDIVRIVDSLDVVEQFQVGHGGVNDLMEKCVGQCGKIIRIDEDGDLRIKFGFASGSRSWTFNPACCAKVQVTPQDDVSELLGFKTYDFVVGDVVKIIESADDMERLQDGHGGFNQKMKLSLGKLGCIIKIDDDGDLYVKTEPRKWVLNPECCIKVTDESLIAKAPVIDKDDKDDDMLSLGDLLKLKRKLSLLKELIDEESSIKSIPIDKDVSLSVGDQVQILDDLETVKQFQEGHGGWVDDMKSSLGKIGIVKRFLEGVNGYQVHVKFGDQDWGFNPLCCCKIDKPQPEPSESQACVGQLTGQRHIEKFNKRMDDMLGNLGVAAFSKETEILKEVKNMKKGDTKMLKEKLDKNPVLVNAEYMDVSVLQLACYLGNIEVIKCLIERNVDLQTKFKDGNTALHSATYEGLSRVISLLLGKKVNPDEKNKEGFTSLHIAVQIGSVTCAKVLLENNASVNAQDSQGNTPMHTCTAQRSTKIELIDAIFSVSNADFGIQNLKGQNVLQYLSENNCHHAAEIVCERRPDIVNVQHKKVLYTALHICAKWNHDLVAAAILKNGGDPNIVNSSKSTPLHVAVKEGHHRFVKLLVQNGCKLDEQDNDGNTALHLAQILKPDKRDVAYKITQILINHRANVEIRNNERKLAVDLCNDMKMKELLKRDFSSNWDPIEGTKSMLVTLSENKHQDEYQDVCKQFQETMPNAKIFNIKRVQNKQLLDTYNIAKDCMEDNNSTQNINERHLFHGTRPDLVHGICTKTTDPRHSGCLGHPLGEGTYYATKAECANKLTKANDDQHRFMILCTVLAGRWTLGQPSYMNPPPIDPADSESDCYDSCVDDINDPTMFCVFHTNQFYPKYIIEYADIEESSNAQKCQECESK